jgi:hypothetical protein
MMRRENSIPEPPKTLKSIQIGFDAITQHVGLILFPLILDLIIWFAPHVRIKRQIEDLITGFFSISNLDNADLNELLQASQEVWTVIAERFNLVVTLRSFPVGIFSLLSSLLPVKTPFGDPLFVEVNDPGKALLIVLLFLLIGMVMGAFYYAGVNRAALYDEVRWQDILTQWPWLIKHTLLLSLIWFVFFIGLSLLGGCFITGAALINSSFAQGAFLLFSMVYIWMLFPLFFSPHGIFVEKKMAWRSVYESIRMTTLSFLQTGFFIILAVLITQGLDVVWQVPPEDSWLMLISITGHAFVSTGVLAASFVFYQDMNRWIKEIVLWQQRDISPDEGQL